MYEIWFNNAVVFSYGVNCVVSKAAIKCIAMLSTKMRVHILNYNIGVA